MPFTVPPPPPPAPSVRLVNPDGTPTLAYIEWQKRLNDWLKRLIAAIP